MTINNSMPTGQLSITSQRAQSGSAVIEFPLIVLIFMIILWGFVAVFRLFYTQIQLDNVTYNLVNALSTTEFEKVTPSGNSMSYLSDNLSGPLLTLADRYLPDNIEASNIGITVESYIYDIKQSSWKREQIFSGVGCEVEKPIDQLDKNLKVIGAAKYNAISNKNSTLLQLTLCVNDLFEDESFFPLPTGLSSSSVLIGKQL